MDNPEKNDCIEHSRDTGRRQTTLRKHDAEN